MSPAVDALHLCDLLTHAYCMAVTPEVRDSSWWLVVLLRAYDSCMRLLALGCEPESDNLWLHAGVYFALVRSKPGNVWPHQH